MVCKAFPLLCALAWSGAAAGQARDVEANKPEKSPDTTPAPVVPEASTLPRTQGREPPLALFGSGQLRFVQSIGRAPWAGASSCT